MFSFPRSLSTSGMCPKSQFLYGKLTFVKVMEWGKWVKVPLGCLLVHWNFSWNLDPDLQSAQKKEIFSTRYIHIPGTSKYPEKLIKLWKLCGKLPFYGDLEGLGYIYIYTSTDWNFECYAPFLRGVYRQLECSMMPHLSFQYIFIYLNLNILGQHSNCLFATRGCAAF